MMDEEGVTTMVIYPAMYGSGQEEYEKALATKRQEWYAERIGGLMNLKCYTMDRLIQEGRMKEAVEAAKKFDRTTDNLYIYGPTGSGKTHLAVAIAQQHLDAGVEVLKPMQIFRRLRGIEAQDEDAAIRGLINTPVLVIDDLGVEKLTEFGLVTLYEVIDGRYSSGVGGLIVTANLGPDALSAKLGDDRIPSRLFQMSKLIDLTGDRDHRLDIKHRG